MEERVFQKMMEPFDPAEGEAEQRTRSEEGKPDDQEEESDGDDEEGFVDEYNPDDPYDLRGFIVNDDFDNLDEAIMQHLFDRQDHEDQMRLLKQENEQLIEQEEQQRREFQEVQENLEHWQRLVEEKVQERDSWLQMRGRRLLPDQEDEDLNEP